MDDGAYVDPRYAKSADYANDLAEIAEAGVCPFCPDNMKWHPNPILARHGDWFATKNGQPYDNAEQHYLIIGEVHKVHLAELTATDLENVHELASRLTHGDEVVGGGLVLRFGPTKYTGATVQHLHFHLIIPEIDPVTDRAKTVNFPIG
jgi:ATP adenylyltransferase